MMLIRAFLAQNVATGCAFGGFATSILAVQDRFDTTRGMAALALALTVLAMSGLGPLVAAMISQIGLRSTMTLGAMLAAVGYILLALVQSIEAMLAVCLLAIGPGASLLGGLPPSILAGNWHPEARGRAVGIAYIPFLVTFIPLLGVAVMQRFGLPAFFLSLAALHLFLLPVLLGVSEPPQSDQPEHAAVDAASAGGSRPAILTQPLFWAILLGEGILQASTITGSAHIVAIAAEYGVASRWGMLLLSIKGFASIFGSVLAGLSCDRFGTARTLGLAGVGLTVSWLIISMSGWLPALALAMAIMGISGAAIFPVVTVLVAQIFGVAAFPRVLGLLGAFTLPFTFGAPVAGWLRDTMGDYRLAILLLISASLAAAIDFGLIGRATRVTRTRAVRR
ncbi:MFS transporter [Sphingobium vermicomposti]|nr:MFS transporter [Sphingobium vermicomposti]